jgi:ribonuclease BN (tRNA processing enzyme)
MKMRVLGAFGAEGLGQRPSSFLFNDRVLVDGGTVGGALTVAEQALIEHALITHSHLDHVTGVAFLSETLAFRETGRPLTIASLEPVIDAIHGSVFNNIAWPDFSQIPHSDAPTIRFRSLVEEAEQRVGDLWVTPVAVSHTVPTSGFVIHDGTTGVVYSGDTGPTDALWKAARGLKGLRAVLLECAFPDRLGDLAEVAKHMTPALIRRELDKLPPSVPVLIYHAKPQFHEEIAEQIARIGGPITLLEQDKTYTF